MLFLNCIFTAEYTLGIVVVTHWERSAEQLETEQKLEIRNGAVNTKFH